MKDYLLNKQPKDPRFLEIFKRSFNLDRKRNGFTVADAANELGMSEGTLVQKLKPSDAGDFLVSEWNHFLELSDDFSTLEYFASKHGFKLQSKNTVAVENGDDIHKDTDNAMIEFSQAFTAIKTSLSDNCLTSQEKKNVLKELYEAEGAIAKLIKDIENYTEC